MCINLYTLFYANVHVNVHVKLHVNDHIPFMTSDCLRHIPYPHYHQLTYNRITFLSSMHLCDVIDALYSGDAFLRFHLHEAKRSSESGEYLLGVDAPCCAMP